ncbi:hypothetical protein [Neorhizobium sp. DAR64872/K0K18]|uniref:hypothetical protein n=1 Tax=Neorhizobium sp. DAR64872/K0K18 TaxID=3421958 RepID=UPI003D2DB9F6
MSSFRVGQKVVCVWIEKTYPDGFVVLQEPNMPEIGRVYTVRAVIEGLVKNTPCIKVEEIADQRISALLHGDFVTGDVVFEAAGFRPLVERKSDISIFKAMLTPSRVEEHA